MKTDDRFRRRANVGCSGLLAAAIPSLAHAEYNANLSTPGTAIAGTPLDIHGYFMIVLTVLFIAVFCIMLFSMTRQHKEDGDHPARFAGPTGRVQWLWATVPFAILLFIDYVLLSIHFSS